MTTAERTRQLEARLIDFTVRIARLAGLMHTTFAGAHFAKQLVRSGSAPALLYGEARSAESAKDFRHKMSIALKELRETHINLRIVNQLNVFGEANVSLDNLISENNELISIFVAAVKTTSSKLRSTSAADEHPPR